MQEFIKGSDLSIQEHWPHS